MHSPSPRQSAAPATSVVSPARRPWMLERADGRVLRVRGAGPVDLPALAAMHGRCSGRCSGRTLLQRYRAGGRAPSLAVLAGATEKPQTFVVEAVPRCMVAVVTAELPDATDPWRTDIALVVEDAWQGLGIGTAVAQHVAASLRIMGVHQVTTRSALPSLPLLHVMEQIGTTQATRGPDGCSVLTSRIEVSIIDGFGGELQLSASMREGAG